MDSRQPLPLFVQSSMCWERSTFSCLLQMGYKRNCSYLGFTLRRVWAIPSFLSWVRSLYGWKVTVACPPIGLFRRFMLFLDEVIWKHLVGRLKHCSAYYSSSELQWSMAILRCFDKRGYFFWYPVVGGQLFVAAEYWCLTLLGACPTLLVNITKLLELYTLEREFQHRASLCLVWGF